MKDVLGTLEIHTGKYFTGGFYYAGWALLLAGAAAAMSQSWIYVLLFLLVGMVVLTTHYRININTKEKYIEEYVVLFGVKTKVERFNFAAIDYFFVKEQSYVQKLGSRGSTSTIKSIEYDAYVVADGKKFHVGFSKNQKKLVSKTKAWADVLKVPIKVVDI